LTDTNKEWLLSFVSGQNFYDKKCKNSKMTELIYISRIASYCFNVGKNPEQLIGLKLEGLQNPASIKEFQAEELLENFLRQATYLKPDKEGNKIEAEFTESSKVGVLAAVKSFYESTRGRALTDDTGEFIEVPEAKKRTPKVEECLELENAMKCNRDKFLVWFLESCPVRKSTLIKLKFGDLKPLNDKDVPFWLRIGSDRLKGHGKGKFKKARHVGFLHYYAVQKFDEYKAELSEKGLSFNDDTPLFVSYKSTKIGSKKGDKMTNIFAIFVDASDKAFKGKKRFSPHDFRDVLSTVLMNPKVKANTNLTKPLTSHVPTGIEATYENPDDSEDKPNSDLLAVFKSCIPFLIPETIPELKIELNEQKAENQKRITELERQLEEMPTKIRQQLEALVPEIKKLYS
jgi:site-specific recombinase XerD